jgi:hypothetical protein
MENPINKSDAINKNSDNTSSSTTQVVDTDSVIKQIEKEGMEAVKKLPNRFCQDSLINIMKNGETTFIEKTGRQMTYAEMRAAYG